MDKKISIINTRDNDFEFDISIEGVESKDMRVSFVIETKELNLQFPCKEGEKGKWSVNVPPMPLLELASYPFCVTIVVDGYFFEPFKGTAMVIHEPTVTSSATKKMAPPVVTMSGGDEEEEEEAKPVKKKVAKKKAPAKKKTPVRRKKVAKKEEPKEEKVEETIEPVQPVEKEEVVILDPEDMGEPEVIEEVKVEEIPEDSFGGMADALLKKHKTPRAGLAPTTKMDNAVMDVLENLTPAPKKAPVPKKAKVPTSKHGTFANAFGKQVDEGDKKSGTKDKAVQDILLGVTKK